MKIKNLLIGTCVLATSVSGSAANDILATNSQGYLARGVAMYNDKNYVGAEDQLHHMKKMPASSSMIEEADFYIAMCLFQQGNEGALTALNAFIANYPTSFHNPEITYNIGNYYFYAGKYGEAVINYSMVPQNSLSTDQNCDLIYRTAYSNLRLGNYDTAKIDFKKIANTPKYREAVNFYLGYVAYVNGDYTEALQYFGKVNSSSELGYKSQYYSAQIYFAQKDYSKVTSLGQSLLARGDGSSEFDSEINRLVGESYYHLGDDSNVASYLNKHVGICKKNDVEPARSACYILGVLDYRGENYAEALSQFSHVTTEDDELAQSSYLYVGQCYLKQDNLNSASIAFEKAFKMPFDKSVQETAFYNYAVAQNSGGRTPFSNAIDVFEEFLNKYPDSRYADNVEGYLVNAYITGNDFPKALASISHIKKPSAKVLKAKQYVLYNLGIDAYSNHRTTEALNQFKAAQEIGKYSDGIANECSFWIGDCQYKKGEYASAEKNFNSFLNGTTAKNANYDLANYNLGYCYFQQRSYGAARAAFEKSIAGTSSLKESVKADALNRIGDAFYYSKQYAQAEDKYNQAHALNPSSGDYALYQKAMMNGLDRQYSTKIKQMDQLLSSYPSSSYAPNALFEKAQAQIALNDNNGAASTFERLLSLFPESVEARKGLLQLAITEKNIGNESKAITTYKKVITKYPSSEEASLAAEDLKVIYADNNDINSLAKFLQSTPNAPKVDVSEMDKFTYFAAEKAFTASKSDVTKLKEYLKRYPNGAYILNAKFYVAKDYFSKGKYQESLSELNYVIENGKDASFAEDAIAMKAAILVKQGHDTDALASYKALSNKATTADNKVVAYLGVMRTAINLNRFEDALSASESLLKLGGLSSEEEQETRFVHASACEKLNRSKEAVKEWTKLSEDTRNIYGARATYNLAEHYYNSGDYKTAAKVLNNFIENGTPHQYWLARGFILLSDVYKKQGKTFEAREYLESLKSNYPGKDSDIFLMIDERLKALKK